MLASWASANSIAQSTPALAVLEKSVAARILWSFLFGIIVTELFPFLGRPTSEYQYKRKVVGSLRWIDGPRRLLLASAVRWEVVQW